jgi:prepilin-type N-terminal cleavage/methylation domain-containing protein
MMRNTNQEQPARGFTLIELIIVIAVIGILTAIIVPTLQSSTRKANEASAISTLNVIKVSQAKYTIDHKDQFGTFKQLYAEGYLDKRFNSDQPNIRGYFFIITLTPKAEGKTASYSVNANPEQWEGIGATGKNFYYVDPNGGICVSKTGPASAADDSL